MALQVCSNWGKKSPVFMLFCLGFFVLFILRWVGLGTSVCMSLVLGQN